MYVSRLNMVSRILHFGDHHRQSELKREKVEIKNPVNTLQASTQIVERKRGEALEIENKVSEIQ
jgi:hypothetical protein